jgi:cytochrome P450 family 6
MVTMDVIAAQAFVFILAGFKTSSTTMTFCLYKLAENPDIQEQAQDEMGILYWTDIAGTSRIYRE